VEIQRINETAATPNKEGAFPERVFER